MASLRRSARLSGNRIASPAVGTVTLAPRKRKSTSTTATATANSKAGKEASLARPSTPPPPPPSKKRQARSRTKTSARSGPTDGDVVPTTPRKAVLPDAASVAAPMTPKPSHLAVRRLANPDMTNVPLLSPETSRVVSALPLEGLNTPAARLKTTTANILEEACAHLVRVDPRMKPLVDAHYCHVFSPAGLAKAIDPFESLASGIISQQVSGAAARAIKKRFVGLFNDGADTAAAAAADAGQAENGTAGEDAAQRFPHPSQVAATSLERLRSAGLSQRKAEYLHGLAEKFVSGELSAQLLAEAPYETLVERLVAVRGLGLWSVQMFAVFGLKRLDVFSVGDLGVQRGMAAFVGRDVAKLKRAGGSAGTKKAGGKWKYMTDTEMEAIAEPFRPYRSVFMWYMWQVESTVTSSME
ncbi:DNA base-excision repair protein [Niveomyces insectorum RCEF 264]|uniref:DNA base-excision repair protein n=1 Tax=Niveomyces insectorum RCEF 264 TaxID=1081102 RepID=A0A162MPL7_9HYPO|nr:DNA base-excision repair protein [Niveomyces insectorum RCEF 264]